MAYLKLEDLSFDARHAAPAGQAGVEVMTRAEMKAIAGGIAVGGCIPPDSTYGPMWPFGDLPWKGFWDRPLPPFSRGTEPASDFANQDPRLP